MASLRQNIEYNSAASDEQIVSAASAALVADSADSADSASENAGFLERVAGSRGFSRISGGEKQRVACARAVARGAEVLILD